MEPSRVIIADGIVKPTENMLYQLYTTDGYDPLNVGLCGKDAIYYWFNFINNTYMGKSCETEGVVGDLISYEYNSDVTILKCLHRKS